MKMLPEGEHHQVSKSPKRKRQETLSTIPEHINKFAANNRQPTTDSNASTMSSEKIEINNNEPDVVLEAAKNFYKAIIASHRFSWVGIFETRDEFEQSRLVVYLHETSTPPVHNRRLVASTKQDMGKAFDDLYFALLPSVLIDLYYNRTVCDNEDELVKNCSADVRKRFGANEQKALVKLLHSENLPQ